MVASVACAQLTQLSSQTALRRTASSARISAKRHPSVARSSGVVVRAVRAEAAAGDADDRVETGRSGLVTKVASLVVTALASAVVALPASAAFDFGGFTSQLPAAIVTPEEQIAEQIAAFEAKKATCATAACRDTTTQWEEAAVKKIKKKAGMITAPAPRAYPSAPRVNVVPAASAPVAAAAPDNAAAPAAAAALDAAASPAPATPDAVAATAPAAAAAAPTSTSARADARAAFAAERKAAADAASDAAARQKEAKMEAKTAAVDKAAADRRAAATAADADKATAADAKAAAIKQAAAERRAAATAADADKAAAADAKAAAVDQAAAERRAAVTAADADKAAAAAAKAAEIETVAAERRAVATAADADKAAAAVAKAAEIETAAAEKAILTSKPSAPALTVDPTPAPAPALAPTPALTPVPPPVPAPAVVKKVETPTKPAPVPAKKVEAATPKPAAKKSSPGVVDYLVGDVTVAALAAAAATVLLLPAVKGKALEGDFEGAFDDAKQAVTSIDGLPGKAAYIGGVIAADAAAHLPLLGFLFPGPLEFVGTSAAVLLAARYYVSKDSTPGEDVATFVAGISPDAPSSVDDVIAPVTALAGKFQVPDVAAAQQDVTDWFNSLEDPVEELAPAAAALGVAFVASQIAHFPLLGLVLPRVLELVGVAYAIAAVNRYGRDNTNASLSKDLQGYAKTGGDAIKTLISK